MSVASYCELPVCAVQVADEVEEWKYTDCPGLAVRDCISISLSSSHVRDVYV